jgi:hypothetical protein
MISRDKILEILKALGVKVANRQVRWNSSGNPNGVFEFWIVFPNSTLYLRYNSPMAEFDNVEIEIKNDDEQTVGFARVEEEDDNWTWVKALFDEVERQVTGSDRILDEIEDAVRSSGEIGTQY